MDKAYLCKACLWTGTKDDLEIDIVDTCFGADNIEMCPACGSYEPTEINQEETP